MAIYKSNAADKYTVIPNDSVRDKSLSFEATGLLCFLLSLPSDWAIHKSWLKAQKIGCGRDKLTRLISELEKAGHMRKEVSQLEDGKLNGFDWFVYPTAQLKNRKTDKPRDGETPPTKERSLEIKDSINYDQSKIDRDNFIKDAFEYWWSKWPKKVAKKATLKIWQKITKAKTEDEVRALTNHIADDVALRMADIDAGGRKYIGFDMLHPSTYLNQERYNDDI